jgi:hypothetical protein
LPAVLRNPSSWVKWIFVFPQLFLILHLVLKLLDASPGDSTSSRTRGVEFFADFFVGLFRPLTDALGIQPPPTNATALDLRAVLVLVLLTAVEIAILLGIHRLDRRPTDRGSGKA